MQPATYLNPFTDFGFKKLFGEEYNKDLLIDFLNQLLKKEQGRIKTLTYLKNEQLGRSEADRRAVFDLYCENEQGKSGDWDFELKAVYTVAILDFVFDEDKKDRQKFRYDVKLTDIETCKVFYDKLTFVYLEMPKFEKTLEELESRFDKWLYVLKNLERLHDIPDKLKDRIFRKLFAAAEIAKFTPEESRAYEDSLKVYRDLKNSIDTAREEGEIKGHGAAMEKAALKMFGKGISLEVISDITGLSPEQIKKLTNLNRVSETATAYNPARPGRKPRKISKAK